MSHNEIERSGYRKSTSVDDAVLAAFKAEHHRARSGPLHKSVTWALACATLSLRDEPDYVSVIEKLFARDESGDIVPPQNPAAVNRCSERSEGVSAPGTRPDPANASCAHSDGSDGTLD